MEIPEILKDEGVQKWATLGCCIAGLEFIGSETLTHAFQRGLDSDVGKYVCLGGLALTGAHLLNVLPREIDPYYYIADGVDYLSNKFKK